MGGFAAKTTCPVCGAGYPVKRFNKKDPNRRYHTCNGCGHRGVTQDWVHADRRCAAGRFRTPEERAEFDRQRSREYYRRMKGETNNPLSPEKAEALRQARREANRRYLLKKGHKTRVPLTPEQEAEKKEAARIARNARLRAKRAAEREARPPKPVKEKPVRIPRPRATSEQLEAKRIAREAKRQEREATKLAKLEAKQREAEEKRIAREAAKASAAEKVKKAAEVAAEIKPTVAPAVIARKRLEDFRLMKSLGLLDD